MGGIQIAVSIVHMHLAGIRAKVQQIRDGVHIANVYESKGYDFNSQALKYNLWKLLPGDSLIISCFYRPDPLREIVGGWGSDDEMCKLFLGVVGEFGSFEHGTGWMVLPTQP